MILFVIFLILLVSTGCIHNMKGVQEVKEATPVKASFNESDPLHLGVTRMLIAKGYYELALAQLREIIKKDPKNPEIYYLMGCAFREKKMFKEAHKSFNKAISLAPEYANAYDGLGITYDLEGRHKEAVKMYKKAISINPGIAKFYNNLGFSLYLQGDFTKAIEAFQKALHIDPDNKKFFNNLGYAYGMKGEYETAWQVFKKGGDIATAYNNMGFVYQMNGDLERAEEMYEKALEVKPNFMKAYNNLKEIRKAIAEIKKRRHKEDILKVFKKKPTIPEKGRIYQIKGDYEKEYQM